LLYSAISVISVFSHGYRSKKKHSYVTWPRTALGEITVSRASTITMDLTTLPSSGRLRPTSATIGVGSHTAGN